MSRPDTKQTVGWVSRRCTGRWQSRKSFSLLPLNDLFQTGSLARILSITPRAEPIALPRQPQDLKVTAEKCGPAAPGAWLGHTRAASRITKPPTSHMAGSEASAVC